MLFTGDAAKGDASVQFPWQQIQQQKMQELAALDQQMEREAGFQKQEQAIQSDIYKQLAEQGKANFLPGDQQRFKEKYEELKNKLSEQIDGYSSVQGFMANEGAMALGDFANELIGSKEYSNGIQNRAEYERYGRQVDAGKLYHKMSGIDAEGNEIAFDTPSEANQALESGKITRLAYKGAYENEFDPSKLFMGNSTSDIIYTEAELKRELINQNLAPQVQKQVLEDYRRKGGEGYYKFKADPNLALQAAKERMALRLAQANANKEDMTTNYWAALTASGGVTKMMIKKVQKNTNGQIVIGQKEVYGSVVTDPVALRPDFFGLRVVKGEVGSTAALQGNEKTDKSTAEKYELTDTGTFDFLVFGNQKSPLSTGGAYAKYKTALFDIGNKLGYAPGEVIWDVKPMRVYKQTADGKRIPTPDKKGFETELVDTPTQNGRMTARVRFSDEKARQEVLAHITKDPKITSIEQLPEQQKAYARKLMSLLKTMSTEGVVTARVNANAGSGKQLMDLKNQTTSSSTLAE